MDITAMIRELHGELSRMNDAIAVLERLALTRPKKRGRSPNYLKAARVEVPAFQTGRQHKRVFTKATRKKMAASQKLRWKNAKKEASKA